MRRPLSESPAARIQTPASQRRSTGRALAGASGGRLARAGGLLLQLQLHHGNRYVQQVLQHAGLTLDPMEDRHEQAAERVATQVVSRAPAWPVASGTRGGGQPLPEQVRDAVEPVVGADLSRVRLHTDARADQLTRALRARACTTGSEIFLRRGEYRPGSAPGRRLLAHELAHVAQQQGSAAGTGAIQRMKIAGLDTDDADQLKNLRKKTFLMKLSEVTDMRAEITKQLGSDKPDGNVQELLRCLDEREQRLASRPGTQPAAVPDPVEALGKKSGSLTTRATELIRSGDGLKSESATDAWVTAAGTWLREVTAFLPDWENWDKDFASLPSAARVAHRPTLARPLRDKIEELEKHQKDLAQRHGTHAGHLQQQQQIAQQATRMKAETELRRKETRACRSLVNDYVYKLTFQLPEDTPAKWEWRSFPDTVPAMLLEWACTAMLAKVEKDKQGWAAALLDGLKRRNNASQTGLYLTVIGHTKTLPGVHGEAHGNWVKLYPSLLGLNLEKVLAGGDPADAKARDDLVASMSSTFIHEYAHARQIQVYDNNSLPWKPHRDYGGHSTAALSGGVPPGQWTRDVLGAFTEFENGGKSGQATADGHWKNFSSSLAGYQNNKGKDQRANELVSHLMELAYAWRDEKKFRAVFPECAALLDRVILKEAAAPGT